MTEQLTLQVAEHNFADAVAWRDANPVAYGAIVAWSYEDAARSGRCAMQRYLEALRDPSYASRLFVHRMDAVYVVNHNVRSSLTRLVLSEHPGLPFHIRKSSCDPGATQATPQARS